MNRTRTAAASAAMILAACTPPPDADPRLVSEWMHTLYGAIRVERLSPPIASRLIAYATTALHAGLAVANPESPSLVGVLNGLADLPRPEQGYDYDGALAAIAAERVVMDSLLAEALPTTRSALARLADSLGAARVAMGVSERVRARSVELGRRIGIAIVAWSRADGFDETRGRPYIAPVGAGLWVNDAPVSTFAAQNLSGASDFVAVDNPSNLLTPASASDRGLILNRPKRRGLAALPPVDITGTLEPHWGTLRPFILGTWDECPLPPPPPYSMDPSSELYREAMHLREIGLHLAPEQQAIALYWADNPGESATPAGHWTAIANQLVSQRGLSAEEAARLMVITAVAQADAFIATWGFKYHYGVLRPRTYIRRVIDPTWEPLVPTPPFPEYPSGHSTQSAAAAAVIAATIADGPFDDSTSVALGHPVRRFESFAAAAEEAGMSRLYGGIHYHFGKAGGKAMGECIGAKTIERFNGAPRR